MNAGAPARPLLMLRGLTKSYPGVRALRGVNFDVAGGEIHALLGENGAGKSTLLKILSGAVRPDAGTIELAGRVVALSSPAAARHAGIALIHQELALVPDMSAASNMYLGRELRSGATLARGAMHRQAQTIVDRLADDIDVRRPVRTLSMAQRQCVEIARALLFRSQVLALDEPTSSLTNRECERLFETLRALRADGVAIVYVSHRLEELAHIADRATVMRDGAVVGTVPIAETSRGALVSMMVGRELAERDATAYRSPAGAALRIEGLRSVQSRLHDVSFEAYRGQILGVAGLVGSGRTELLRAIFGADPIDGGRIFVDGQRFEGRSVRSAIRRKIGLVPEDRKGQALFGRMSIRSNMTLASLGRFARAGVIARSARAAEATALIEDLDLRPRNAARAVGQLSGGNQQKAVVGRWLSAQSDILLVDEPTRGVDVGAKAEIYRILERLTQRGAAVVMVSSDLPEILSMSDRIAVMREGRLVKVLERSAASEETIMHYATGGQ